MSDHVLNMSAASVVSSVPPSLHVFWAGFGSPHVEEKKRILRQNMRVIEASPWSTLQYTICCYDDTDLSEWSGDSRVEIIRERGIVGQFLKRHLRPNTPATVEYDYLLLLLDDVELTPRTVNVGEMAHWLREFHMDVLSPCLTRDSQIQFQYLRHEPQYTTPTLKITSVLEFFCYFTTPAWYELYYSLIDETRNPWGWNLDMMLYRRFGFRVGVLNHMLMKHWYKGESYGARLDADPHEGAKFALERWGVTAGELAGQQAVRFLVGRVGE